MGEAHNVGMADVGRLLQQRWRASDPPDVQLAAFRSVLTDYLHDVVGQANAAALVDQGVNAAIWAAGPSGRFWALRQGSQPPVARALLSDPPTSLSSTAQSFQTQIEQIVGDSTLGTPTKVANINAVKAEGVQYLSASESDYITGIGNVADSSVVYWQAQADSAIDGTSTEPWAGGFTKFIPTAPPGLQRADLGWFNRIMGRLATIGWADVVGAVGGYFTCVQGLVCATPVTWQFGLGAAAAGGILASAGAAIAT